MNVVTCFDINDKRRERIEKTIHPAKLIVADQSDVPKKVFDADIFCGHAKVPVDWKSVVQQGRLRWIQSSASGLDHCLTDDVVASDIVVSGACGLFAQAVAEQTMALLFGLLRRLPTFFHAGQAREYIRRPTDDVGNKTVGIVGFGGNGQRIAQFLLPTGCKVVATDRFDQEWCEARELPAIDRLWPADRLHRLLAESDIVIAALPLNGETQGLFDCKALELMKRGSYFLNVARGRIVIESDLVDALNCGHLQGAGLDVAEIEPLDPASPLWAMPNVIITPHVGAQSADRFDRVTDLFCENFVRFNDKRRLRNHVDKQVGFSLPADRT